MARTCDMCHRGTSVGNNVPRKGLLKKKGGTGSKIGVRTKRTFRVNLHAKKLFVDGVKKGVRICSRCLRAMDKVS